MGGDALQPKPRGGELQWHRGILADSERPLPTHLGNPGRRWSPTSLGLRRRPDPSDGRGGRPQWGLASRG
ncbi:UNVERIFIED_CONTAM: hypothetical protein Sradi_7213100, partial [Sesamum radiatum]